MDKCLIFVLVCILQQTRNSPACCMHNQGWTLCLSRAEKAKMLQKRPPYINSKFLLALCVWFDRSKEDRSAATAWLMNIHFRPGGLSLVDFAVEYTDHPSFTGVRSTSLPSAGQRPCLLYPRAVQTRLREQSSPQH